MSSWSEAGRRSTHATPPWSARRSRYLRIARDFGDLVTDHQVNGLHVHVEIDDREEGVRALNGVRLWLPCLLAPHRQLPLLARA